MSWRWPAPAAALAAHHARELVLPFPTRHILASLVNRAGVAGVLESARGRPVPPIQPRIVRVDGQQRILLPDDSASWG